MLKHREKHKKKSINVKRLTKIVWFQQFLELDRISHGADVVGQSVPGGRTCMWERPLAELRNPLNLNCFCTNNAPSQPEINTEQIALACLMFKDIIDFLMFWTPIAVDMPIRRRINDWLGTARVGLGWFEVGLRYDTRCYFNVRSKADMSRLNLPHGNNN